MTPETLKPSNQNELRINCRKEPSILHSSGIRLISGILRKVLFVIGGILSQQVSAWLKLPKQSQTLQMSDDS